MTRRSRGYVEFDPDTPQLFIDLVVETLAQSEFIETGWDEGPPHVADDVLAIYEVDPEDALTETPSNAVALAEGRIPGEVEKDHEPLGHDPDGTTDVATDEEERVEGMTPDDV